MGGLLLTRAMPEAEESAAAISALGFDVLVAPLRLVEPLPHDLPASQPNALIATSRNAFAGLSLPSVWRALPLFVLGGKSADAARRAGFSDVTVLGGTAEALAEMLIARKPSIGKWAYLAGIPRRNTIEARFAAARLGLDVIETYRMVRVPTFPAEAEAAIRGGRISAVMHFSAESARACFDLADAAGIGAAMQGLDHLCLSAPVAAMVGDHGASGRILIAATPDHAAMIALLADCSVSRTP